MPLSTDITLPKDRKPLFPEMCIVCHEKPDSTVGVAQHYQNPFLVFAFPILHLFGWDRILVPICRGCKFRFRLERWGRELLCWTIIGIAVFLIAPYFKEWRGFQQKLAIAALVLGAFAPFAIVGLFWPRVFDTTVGTNTIDYEFASEDYALRFALMNRSWRIEANGDDE